MVAPSTPIIRSRGALVAISLGFFLIQLDATIVNVALPSMQRSVGGSLGGLQWIVDAYALALAAAMLTAGSAADRLGARRVFLAGVGAFGLGSAACAVAPTPAALIAARSLQGLGGAALLPSSLALLVHRFPDRADRARALGMWGGIGSLGMAAGPVLGGALASSLGWRSIFAVNLPLCGIVAALVWACTAESPRQAARSSDPLGTVLGWIAIGGLCGACIEWGERGGASPWPVLLLLMGIAGGASLLWVERRQAAPMLPLGIFSSPAFSAATALGVLFNFCLYGTLLCLSLYLQHGAGESAALAGLSLLPLVVAVGAGAIVSGRLTARWGARPAMLAGMTCGASGAGLIAAASVVGSVPLVLAGTTLLGCCSLAMPAMTSVAVGALAPERSGLAGGVLNAARQSGGALGVAVLGAVLAASARAGGHLSLEAPLLVAALGYVVAIGVAWVAGRARTT